MARLQHRRVTRRRYEPGRGEGRRHIVAIESAALIAVRVGEDDGVDVPHTEFIEVGSPGAGAGVDDGVVAGAQQVDVQLSIYRKRSSPRFDQAPAVTVC